jgi:hypothetical protein
MASAHPGSVPTLTAPPEGSRDIVLDRYERHVNKSLASICRLIAAPVETRSAGARVYGEYGEAYLDCGGFGVFLLGHCHPSAVGAVRRQLEVHPLATRLFLNPQLAAAATALSAIAPAGLDYVFLTNSGAEAVEVGLTPFDPRVGTAGKPDSESRHPCGHRVSSDNAAVITMSDMILLNAHVGGRGISALARTSHRWTSV